MSYATQSQLAVDQDFLNRCTSCAAVEIHAAVPGSPTPPQQWVYANAWYLAGTPGFGDAYDSAVAAGIGRPGWQASVISDAQILSAVQSLLAQYPPQPKPGV